jgi:hypothetical protein
MRTRSSVHRAVLCAENSDGAIFTGAYHGCEMLKKEDFRGVAFRVSEGDISFADEKGRL